MPVLVSQDAPAQNLTEPRGPSTAAEVWRHEARPASETSSVPQQQQQPFTSSCVPWPPPSPQVYLHHRASFQPLQRSACCRASRRSELRSICFECSTSVTRLLTLICADVAGQVASINVQPSMSVPLYSQPPSRLATASLDQYSDRQLPPGSKSPLKRRAGEILGADSAGGSSPHPAKKAKTAAVTFERAQSVLLPSQMTLQMPPAQTYQSSLPPLPQLPPQLAVQLPLPQHQKNTCLSANYSFDDDSFLAFCSPAQGPAWRSSSPVLRAQ